MPTTINPANGKQIETYEYITREEITQKIELAHTAFQSWKNTPYEEKKSLFFKLADLMLERKDELAETNVIEMGMLLSNWYADVSKTESGIRYVCEHAKDWIKPEQFNEWWLTGEIVYEPLWVIYTVSPWNFPYNQVFRNACPNIMAWNVVISKHASNVPWAARAIEKLFIDAWFPIWVYQNLQIDSKESEYILSHPYVRWTNLTGWESAWRVIGSLAGKNLKPSILELGWSDPFLLLDTDDVKKSATIAAWWRLSCSGQKCNSSKRIIVLEKYYDEFCDEITKIFESKIVWDPFLESTQVWPLALEKQVQELELLVHKSIDMWAKLLTWWTRINREWFYFAPTVVKDVVPGMPLFDEESFGPVAPIIKAKDIEHAIKLANTSRFGLTAWVFTKDESLFKYVSERLETWLVFWNKIPTSYPFLPYGWIKDTWYGRELWEKWIKNFMNPKVVVY